MVNAGPCSAVTTSGTASISPGGQGAVNDTLVLTSTVGGGYSGTRDYVCNAGSGWLASDIGSCTCAAGTGGWTTTSAGRCNVNNDGTGAAALCNVAGFEIDSQQDGCSGVPGAPNTQTVVSGCLGACVCSGICSVSGCNPDGSTPVGHDTGCTNQACSGTCSRCTGGPLYWNTDITADTGVCTNSYDIASGVSGVVLNDNTGQGSITLACNNGTLTTSGANCKTCAGSDGGSSFDTCGQAASVDGAGCTNVTWGPGGACNNLFAEVKVGIEDSSTPSNPGIATVDNPAPSHGSGLADWKCTAVNTWTLMNPLTALCTPVTYCLNGATGTCTGDGGTDTIACPLSGGATVIAEPQGSTCQGTNSAKSFTCNPDGTWSSTDKCGH